MSWTGRRGDVLRALEEIGADRDEGGDFVCGVPPSAVGDGEAWIRVPVSGDRKATIVIPDSLRYRKLGLYASLADYLKRWSKIRKRSPRDYFLGDVVKFDGHSIWRVVSICEESVSFSGPSPCRGMRTVPADELDKWAPVEES